jgi:hypothetical protein
MRRSRSLLSILFIGLCIGGCKRPGATVILPKKTVAELRSVSQLVPNRTVHVAADPSGKVYYIVETSDAADGVLVVDESGIPRATQLTSANILAAMGESFGGTGSIQSLVAGTDGTLWFYFNGGKGRRVRACVGQFVPRLESISIVFDTKALTDLSGMGDSLPLARGTLIPCPGRVYLLLRHADAWSLFHFANVRRALNTEFKLVCPFTKIWEQDRALDITRTNYELSAGEGDALLLMDRNEGSVWSIDAAGRALPRIALTGLPREVSNPLVLKDGMLMFFAAESEPFNAEVSQLMRPRIAETIFPALLRIKGDDVKAIGRSDLRPVGNLPVYAMRIRELSPQDSESWVGYDQSSGQLVQIKLMEVD